MKINKPSKRNVLLSLGILIGGAVCTYGVICAVNNFIVYKERKLDEYALNRVSNQEVLRNKFVTENKEKITVPVIVKSEVDQQIRDEIANQLKP